MKLLKDIFEAIVFMTSLVAVYAFMTVLGAFMQ